MSATTQTRFLLSHYDIRRRILLISGSLTALLLLVIVVSAAHGPARIAYDDVARLILRALGFTTGLDLSNSSYAIVNQVRLPRILVGMMVGAGLACSGATLQGIFRNPLADPSIIGVSVGGSLGAVIAISFGLADNSLWTLPVFSFVGAMGSAAAVYGLSLVNGRSQPATLLLAGVALNALLGALISALLLFTNRFPEVQAILVWLIGGLRGRGWQQFGVVVGPIAISVILLIIFARDINLLLMGEETAQGLGVNVGRARLALMGLAALSAGAAVSITGPIGFVGLLVPHGLRLIVGPDYRVLMPASAIGGAAFLIGCDTIARLILQPAELQVGIVTALLGAPFFLFLLYRNRRLVQTL
jgi:iron complex transport system permease protein